MIPVSDAKQRARLRGVVLPAAAAALVILFAGQAGAAEKQAAMVLDANSGKVLYASHADELRYPASLTKMMTIYMVFEAIETGRMTWSTKVPMTETAAAQPPSKLGLKVGETISVRDAVKALVTKSANDAAAAVAEHIAGSEWKFARLMTERAGQLGLTATTFKNASGLPDDAQLTTARDMLQLALRLQDDFPQHYHHFALTSFSYNSKTYRNHNALLRSMKGVDGIKTGYTRASGFNLVTSMRHDGKHIVAAVFGSKTSRARNARMRSLIYRTIKRASKEKTRKKAPLLIAKASPAPRPRAVARPGAAPVAAAPVTQQPRITMARVRPVSILAPPAVAHRPDTQRLVAQPTGAGDGRARQPSTLDQQAAELSPRPAAVPLPLATQRPAATAGGAQAADAWGLNGPMTSDNSAGTPARGGFQIQVGAFTSAAEAERQAEYVQTSMGGTLSGHALMTLPVVVGGRQYWRVRFAGFEAASASQTCNELRRNNIDCFVAKAN